MKKIRFLYSQEEEKRKLCAFILKKNEFVRMVHVSMYIADVERYITYVIFQRTTNPRVFHSVHLRRNAFINSQSITLKSVLIVVQGMIPQEFDNLRDHEIQCLSEDGFQCIPNFCGFICKDKVFELWSKGYLDEYSQELPDSDWDNASLPLNESQMNLDDLNAPDDLKVSEDRLFSDNLVLLFFCVLAYCLPYLFSSLIKILTAE